MLQEEHPPPLYSYTPDLPRCLPTVTFPPLSRTFIVWLTTFRWKVTQLLNTTLTPTVVRPRVGILLLPHFHLYCDDIPHISFGRLLSVIPLVGEEQWH